MNPWQGCLLTCKSSIVLKQELYYQMLKAMSTTYDQITRDFLKLCLIVSWSPHFPFHEAKSTMQAHTGQLLNSWCGGTSLQIVEICVSWMTAQTCSRGWSHSIAKWSRRVSHWESMSREWKRWIAEKPDRLNSDRAKLPASISAWETAALGTFESMYVKSCPSCIGMHVGVPAQSQMLALCPCGNACMSWGKGSCCQKYAVSLLTILFSP